ncbi:hypothetical protein AB0M46_39685 [Dactylosporangium sp. NPDC051485]|uniref:hypothetical protein n=1 Tax=Dactylosporangium sp. NPDC051485 TaxID=3154846 RepID=UPI00343FABF5
MSTDDLSAAAPAHTPDFDGADFGRIDDHLGDELTDDTWDFDDAGAAELGLARDISL